VEALFGNFPRLSFKHPSKSGHILKASNHTSTSKMHELPMPQLVYEFDIQGKFIRLWGRGLYSRVLRTREKEMDVEAGHVLQNTE
jgi:hypothetical protein